MGPTVLANRHGVATVYEFTRSRSRLVVDGRSLSAGDGGRIKMASNWSPAMAIDDAPVTRSLVRPIRQVRRR
jgi:hypothetical protein